MKILLFGVSNVENTTTGKLLAEWLDFKFYDLDEDYAVGRGYSLCYYADFLYGQLQNTNNC